MGIASNIEQCEKFFSFEPGLGRMVVFPNIRNNPPEIKIVENAKFSTSEFTNIIIPIYFMISPEAHFLGFKVCRGAKMYSTQN